MDRIILHIDLDSFYAAVEELRRPEIRGKPVVICMYSGRSQDAGAVATANYPARELGIRSGMPIRSAKARATPETVFLPADRDHYRQVSGRVMQLFRRHAGLFEQRSIDEAYLDVTASSKGSYEAAGQAALQIKQSLLRDQGLTCTVGIGPNKLVAKMACRLKKPDGLSVVRRDDFERVFFAKPVDKLFGIGPKTRAILARHSIHTIGDLATSEKDWLRQQFGPAKGLLLWEHAHGRDDEPVQELVRQQVSRIATLKKDSRQADEIVPLLAELAADLAETIAAQQTTFRTVGLLVVTARRGTTTRSTTLPRPSRSKEDILEAASRLLAGLLSDSPEAVRRIGIRLSSLSPQPTSGSQASLRQFEHR